MPLLWLAFYSLILLSPNAFLFVGADGSFLHAYHGPLQALTLALALYLFLLSLIGRPHVLAWLLLPLALLVPAEIYYFRLYHSPSSSHIIAIIAETNPAEASDYLRGQLPVLLAIWVAHALLCVGLCLALTRRRVLWPGRPRLMTLLASAVTIIAVVYANTEEAAVPNIATSNSQPHNMISPVKPNLVVIGYPFGVPFRALQYVMEKREIEETERRLLAFRFHAHQQETIAGKQVYVLVIGETGRRDHWQLNGYTRATTPLLRREDNIVNLQNMVSASTATRTAVPYLLTRKPVSNTPSATFPERSIVSAFKEAGFSTYWLSTQSPAGPYDSAISVYAREADHVGFYDPADYSVSQGSFDTVLLQPLQEALARPEEKQLIVLHTLGSHYDYASRYPDNFDRFTPSTKPAGRISMLDYGRRAQIVNSYDNSVLFTDYFLSEVIARLKSAGATAFLFYAADHGEDFLSETCAQAGHGFTDRHNVEIPALAWFSDTYQARFPEKIANLRQHAALPASARNTFFTLADAAAISLDADDPSMSLLNPAFRYHRRLVIPITAAATAVDYDHAKRVGGCEVLASGS